MKDSLGDRMKDYYEGRTRIQLTRRMHTIIRIDGKAFHTYTKGFTRPFDDDLMNDMDKTAITLLRQIQGAKFAFVQSDEISILLTDFDELTTDAWFDYNVQKMVSVSASLATSAFNLQRIQRKILNLPITEVKQEDFNFPQANFDSRVFQLPNKSEVANYFIWRQQDTVRNSISSVAQSLYSHKELNGKNGSDLQEMIFQKGINWNNYSPKYKRGRIIVKEMYEKEGGIRSRWLMQEPPIFTENKEYLANLIPNND